MECNKFFINILAALILLMYISKLNHNSSIAILVTILIAYQATADINLSICIGCIMGSVYVGLQGNNKILKLEGFKSGKKKSKNKSRKVVENMNTPDNTTIGATNDDGVDTGADTDADTDADTGVDEGDFALDTKGSFYENYKSLSKKQVKGLNKDTQNLIDTQKQLIETLNNMGPALKDGKQIMDTFKDYFGSEKSIDKAMENL